MIHIRFSFLVAAAVMVLLGYHRTLLLLFASVTLHEAAHVCVARFFGRRIENVNVTALGEIAVIKHLAFLAPVKRRLTLLAGPFANACAALCLFAVLQLPPAVRSADAAWVGILQDAALYNTVLCVFNLLPVFPLDGGRLLQCVLGCRLGVPRANRFIVRLGRVLGWLLLIPGAAQAVLFPYNISLLCAAVFIRRTNTRNLLPLTCEFFQEIQNKPAMLQVKGVMPVRALAMSAALPLRFAVDRFDWDSLTVVYVNGDKCHMLTESDIMHCVINYGLNGTLGEIYAKIVP